MKQNFLFGQVTNKSLYDKMIGVCQIKSNEILHCDCWEGK